VEDRIENIADNQKYWVAPVLKKIDVEEITANGFINDSDGDVGDGSPTPS
jgi:hypothetical protein